LEVLWTLKGRAIKIFVMRFMAGHLFKIRGLNQKNPFYAAVLWTFLICLSAQGEQVVPPSPEKPWSPPGLDAYEQELAHNDFSNKESIAEAEIDPAKIYDLPELIDIAERSHPQTRVAWENARQAAGALGLTRSAYYPYLAASAAAGFEHGPGLLLASIVSGNEAVEDATLNVEWLLFDFGERKAATAEAREKLMMANVSFNATHQQIVFGVIQQFYDYNIARQKVAVAESSLKAADTVGQAAQARYDNGLATKTDVLEAEQETAQSAYELDSARGDLSDAQVALVESLGIFPTTRLQVADISEKPFAEDQKDSLDDLIERALSQRPDLVAVLAKVRAGQAAVRKARADFYPKISLDATGGWLKVDQDAYNGPYVGNSKPIYGIGVSVNLPIFDGFLRLNQLRIAQSELRSAESELTDSRDTVVREVWKAYTDFNTALKKQESAAKFLDAAQSAFDAALESYRQGLGTYVDVANAQRNLDAARSIVVDTRAAIYTTSAALALSVGDLAKPAPDDAVSQPQS
jgi:outer membrane protein